MGSGIVTALTSVGGGGGGSLPPLVINVPSDFPTVAEANDQLGRIYIAAANVTDNDPTKTNTGQSFLAGDEFVWDGVSSYATLGSTALWLRNISGYLSPVTATDAIGATGTKISKGWFTDLESTNYPTISGISIPTNLTSTGLLTGGAISDAGGATVDVSSGTGFLRTTDSETGTLLELSFASVAGQAIPAGTTRYVGVQYNAGSPVIVFKTSDSWNQHDEFALGNVINEAGTLHIINNPEKSANGVEKTNHRFYETRPLERAERLGGLILGETGTRNVTVTAGELYDRLNEFSISSIDTSGSDTFDSYLGATLDTSGATQWDNDNYNNGGVKTSLTASFYANLWFYIEADNDLVMVYGTGEYPSSSLAENEAAPTVIPARISSHGRLLGRMIFQKGGAATTIIQSAFETVFSATMTTDHNSLSNLTVGDVHTQYYFSAGRSGGQTVVGGTGATENLTLQSTSNVTKGNVVVSDELRVLADTDAESILGRASLCSPTTDVMYLAHVDRCTTADYSLKQLQNGTTQLNSRAANDINLSIGNAIRAKLDSNGIFGVIRTTAGQYLDFTDGTDTFGIYNSAGSPEGVVAADIGSLCLDTTNGNVYKKTTDTVNTGWVNLQSGSDTWDDVMHNGNIFTVLDTENLSATINQNDVTNNPAALTITNTGSGNDITLPNSTSINNGLLTLGGNVDVNGNLLELGSATTNPKISLLGGSSRTIDMSLVASSGRFLLETKGGGLDAEFQLRPNTTSNKYEMYYEGHPILQIKNASGVDAASHLEILSNGNAGSQDAILTLVDNFDTNEFIQLRNTGAISSGSAVTQYSMDKNIGITLSSSGQWLGFNDGTDVFGIYNNAGTPEGVVAADIGSLCCDTTNGNIYKKTTDTANTGWIELQSGTEYWDRTGTTLEPVNDNDNVDIGTGTFTGRQANIEDLIIGGVGTGTKITCSGTQFINLVPTNGNIGIGDGSDTDYKLVFDGNDSDGFVQWMEDEAEMRIGNETTSDYLQIVPGASTIDIAASTGALKVSSGTFALASGTTVNEISTTVDVSSTDDQLCTAKAAYDAIVPGVNVWSRVTGTPNYVIPSTATDDVGATGAKINKGWFDEAEIGDLVLGGSGSSTKITNTGTQFINIVPTNGNIGIGDGSDTDYKIVFDGNGSDGFIQWMEDEAEMRVGNNVTSEHLVIDATATEAELSASSGPVQIGSDLKTTQAVFQNVTTVNAATYDLATTDHILNVTYTGTGAVTSLTLMTAQVVEGRVITIKDAGGNAATNNITIDTEGSETIDGSATFVINIDYDSVKLYCDGSNWFII